MVMAFKKCLFLVIMNFKVVKNKKGKLTVYHKMTLLIPELELDGGLW